MNKKLTLLVIVLMASIVTLTAQDKELIKTLEERCLECSKQEFGSAKYIELGCRSIAELCTSISYGESDDDGSIIIDTGDTTQASASTRRESTAIIMPGQEIKVVFAFANRSKRFNGVKPLVEILTPQGKLLWSNKSQSKYTHNYVFRANSLQSMTSKPMLKTVGEEDDVVFVVPAKLNTDYRGKAIVRTTVQATVGKERKLKPVSVHKTSIVIKDSKKKYRK